MCECITARPLDIVIYAAGGWQGGEADQAFHKLEDICQILTKQAIGHRSQGAYGLSFFYQIFLAISNCGGKGLKFVPAP
ncbi:hypothetical protein TRIP_E340006 [uncultured Spirochaetota bacterium]|uniref:Uncharacterized protein n=1 Tax=uncultured Spirochaetota bacterium TaxID=460511 RepID=A0A652ZY46_9SPIR|nr:hypothetical protein TRIP_E340006 [uncultured Spirochaetota bacterium]